MAQKGNAGERAVLLLLGEGAQRRDDPSRAPARGRVPQRVLLPVILSMTIRQTHTPSSVSSE
jgi:hypothetical protein